MGRLKFLAIFLLGILLLLGSGKNIFAVTSEPTPTPQPPPDSYVLFYPVVAGRTEGDSLYFLKLIRDRLIELLSFGGEKKSEVNLKLATKRLLEAEKLFKSGKTDFAKKTLERFTSKLTSSYEYAMKAKESDNFPELLDQIEEKTSKYQIVFNQLLATLPESEKGSIQATIQKIAEIQIKVTQQLKTD